VIGVHGFEYSLSGAGVSHGFQRAENGVARGEWFSQAAHAAMSVLGFQAL